MGIISSTPKMTYTMFMNWPWKNAMSSASTVEAPGERESREASLHHV
jgi:hypothetical protein